MTPGLGVSPEEVLERFQSSWLACVVRRWNVFVRVFSAKLSHINGGNCKVSYILIVNNLMQKPSGN
jgi:hypothetical protein